MIRSILIFTLLFVTAAFLAELSPGRLSTPGVTIEVHSETRQTFAGFGTSLTNDQNRFQQLTPDTRAAISKMVWTDLNFKFLRLWFNPTVYSANPNQLDLSVFKSNYIDSGIISLAMSQGCTTLLLAPNDVPPRFAAKQAKGADYANFTDAGVTGYAQLLATFIKQLRDQYGVSITATGVLNEPNDRPVRFTDAQWPVMIKTLRQELDNRGLTNVAIIAPEASSCDDTAIEMVDAVKKDPAAWANLSGISTHSYNMAATDDMLARITGTNKTYWQTESSTPGPEDLGNVDNAATSAGRIISDLNHGVTHWFWFIGYEQQDPNDNGTRLIKYDTAKPTSTGDKFYKYYYIQQLSNAFLPGAIAHPCTSSTEGTMTWTYGTKPTIMAAAAQNANGTLSIAVLNFTSNDFTSSHLSSWDRSQGGQSGKAFPITLKIDSLANISSTTFTVHTSDAKNQNATTGTVVATNGVLTLTLNPLQLVTLTGTSVVAPTVRRLPQR